MHKPGSFFVKHQKALGMAAILYVVLLLLSHWRVPSIHVWIIAAVFSTAMNFTYLIEAVSLKRYVHIETLVASSLILMSWMGVVSSPLLLIAAIFGHGCWDVAKHKGYGVAFFTWYTVSCFAVDTVYSLVLLLYYVQVG
jgi:hypothetical protein